MEDEEFKNAARVVMSFILSYIAVFLITTFVRSKIDMNFWQTIIITLLSAAATGLVTFLATSYTSRRTQLQKNTEALQKLQETIGVLSQSQNLVTLFGNDSKSRRSLSDDHMEICNEVNKIKESTGEITSMMEREAERKAFQEKLLTPEQVKINDMAKSIEEMHSQWLNQNKTVVQMQEEIDSLKKENAVLKKELAAYKKSTRKV